MYRFAIVVGLLLALGALTAQAQWRWMRDSAASEFTDADWEILRSEARREMMCVGPHCRRYPWDTDTYRVDRAGRILVLLHDAEVRAGSYLEGLPCSNCPYEFGKRAALLSHFV